MLNNIQKLFFPKIIFQGSKEINHNNETSKIVNLYKLDWIHKENKCNNGNSELPFKYEEKIKNFIFAIPDPYLKEIRRNSWISIYELNMIRDIDSSLKYIYLKPVISYISTSFNLLSDCIFDMDTEFWYRKDDKIICPYLLLYKFWKNQRQVPKSMIMDYVGIPELITMAENDNLNENELDSINEFLSFFSNDINNN